MAVLYLVGVWLGDLLQVPVDILASMMFFIGLSALVFHIIKASCSTACESNTGVLLGSIWSGGELCSLARSGALVCSLVLVGGLRITVETQVLSPNDLRLMTPEEAVIVSVRGRIVSPPELRRVGSEERMHLQLELSSIRLDEAWQSASGKILITSVGELASTYSSGKTIEVDGVLSQPPSAVSPDFYDRRQHLARRGIYRELQTDDFSQWAVTPETVSLTWSERFRKWGCFTLGLGLPKGDPALELMWAMSLGWRVGLTGEAAEPFMQSGTMHLFAISGLHVALVTGILMALLRVIRLNRRWASVLAIPLLWFYAGATGWQPSAVRATLMVSVLLSSWVFKRPVNVLNSLGLAALLILLWDPHQLFRASFQLSFAVVFSLALIVPPVAEWLQSGVRSDDYLPQSLWPLWRRWFYKPSCWLAGVFAVSFGAWLASVPMIAHHFNLFNPVALIINVPVVMCGMAALSSCMGSLFFGLWTEPVAVIFNHSAWFFMKAMMNLSQWSASLPGAWQYVRSPELWMLFGWYSLLVGIGTRWLFKPSVRGWGIFGLGVFAIALIWSWKADQSEIRMTFLSGGPVIHVEDGNEMLIDCGDERFVEFVIPRQRRVRGMDSKAECVVTHSVKHHAGGLKSLAKMYQLKKVYISQAKSTSPVYRDIAGLASKVSIQEVVAGEKIGPWKVLHPANGEDFSRSSDDVLVLKGEFASVRILLLSDLGNNGRQALVRREAELESDILVLSIPDRSLPVDPAFLRLILPKVIVVQDCEFPVTERAPKQWLKSLRETGVPVFSVRETGGLRLTIRSTDWRLENADGALFSHRN